MTVFLKTTSISRFMVFMDGRCYLTYPCNKNILISHRSAIRNSFYIYFIPFIFWFQCSYFLFSDCIGSAFNAKGAMQCPNCRQVEGGQWLYSGGCFLQSQLVRNSLSDPDDYSGIQHNVIDGRVYLWHSLSPCCIKIFYSNLLNYEVLQN